MIIKKKQGNIVYAYPMSEPSEVITQLMEQGLIKKIADGRYEVFSQEAVNGTGEVVTERDYIRIDSTGKPYPNTEAFVRENLRLIAGNQYEVIPKEIMAWTWDEGMTAEIQYLIEHDLLIIREEEEEKYFSAELWGSLLSAAKNAVIVFYEVRRDENGNIIYIDFNFVERTEFEKSYEVLE